MSQTPELSGNDLGDPLNALAEIERRYANLTPESGLSVSTRRMFDTVRSHLSPPSAAAVPSDLTPALRQAIVDIVDSTRGKRAVKGGTECRLCEAWDEYLAAQPKAPSPTPAEDETLDAFEAFLGPPAPPADAPEMGGG